MKEVITIGVDVAKNVFQVHGVDAEGAVIVCRQLRRSQVLPFFKKQPPCLVGMEACVTSHHWARQLIGLGHEVKLMPPNYVKPYVKRNKNDAADAAAICEAVNCALAWPCSAALRNHFAASALSCGTPSLPAYMTPILNCAAAIPCSAAM